MADQLRIALRTPGDLLFLSGPPSLEAQGALGRAATGMEFSPDAQHMAVRDDDGVSILSTSSRQELVRLSVAGVTAVAFSRKGTYLTTWHRPSKQEGGGTDKNLKVWQLSNGAEVLSLHQRSFSRDAWPSVQFVDDESLAFHQVTNAVNIYACGNWAAGVSRRMPLKGVAGVAPCPLPAKPLLAAYVPEAKGSPGFIALYDYSQITASGDAPPPLCRKSFYRANTARFMWNPTGTALLALTASDVDATNQSYYGEQKLYFMAADASNECAEGPVHDVQWSPKGDYFLTVAGFMPAKVTLFTDKCVPKYDLGSGPYSLARWNPFGRFLALAGFGNLPGDVAFYDKKADGKCKLIATTRAENGVALEWSPDGRCVMASTVAPRLRVDNGVQVFKYDGTLLARERRDVLLEARWLPAPEGTFEDRPQSPRAAAVGASAAPGGAAGAAAPLPPQPVRASGYVPPHLRGNPGAAVAAAASFSLARDPNDKGGRIAPGQVKATAAPTANLPPGAAPPASKAASKNAKRRAAAKKKEGEGAAGALSGLQLQ
ncbi:hypothetical protein N2152v2_001348 [Parachlorella kessleri]